MQLQLRAWKLRVGGQLDCLECGEMDADADADGDIDVDDGWKQEKNDWSIRFISWEPSDIASP